MYIEYRRGVSPQSKPVALALAYMLNFLCAGSGCCPLMMECTREANTQQTQKSFENYTQTPIFFSAFYRLPYGRAFHSFSLFNGGSGGGGVVGNDEAKMLLFRLLIVHWAMGSRFFFYAVAYLRDLCNFKCASRSTVSKTQKSSPKKSYTRTLLTIALMCDKFGLWRPHVCVCVL